MIDLDALQAAAEAATPGEWQLTDFNEGMCPPRPLWGVINDEHLNASGDDEAACVDVEIHVGDKVDAAFIAAANPAVILEFVAAYREVVKQREDVADRLSKYLDDSTGGQLSKPWYPMSLMVEDTKAHYAEVAASEHEDSCENNEALDAALSRLARVEALHKPVPMVPGIENSLVCDGCENPGRFVRYPCPTVRALTEGEPGE